MDGHMVVLGGMGVQSLLLFTPKKKMLVFARYCAHYGGMCFKVVHYGQRGLRCFLLDHEAKAGIKGPRVAPSL